MAEPYVPLSMAQQMCLDAMKPLRQRIVALETRIAELEIALRAVSPFLPIGFAATARPNAADDRNKALAEARLLMDAALSRSREHNEMPETAGS